MKKSILTTVVLLLAIFTLNSQGVQKKFNPSGTWKYEAPYAPEAYATGTIIFAEKDKAMTASISFTGSDYKIPAEKVTLDGSSVTILINLEGEGITINLKPESETKMSGVAKGPEGDIPLTLNKQVPPKQ
jgi:hypothetical protein